MHSAHKWLLKGVFSFIFCLFLFPGNETFAASNSVKILSPSSGATLTVGKTIPIRFKYSGLTGSKAVSILVGMGSNSMGSIAMPRFDNSSGTYEYDWIVSEMALSQYESPNNPNGYLTIKVQSYGESGPISDEVNNLHVKKGTGEADSKMTCLTQFKSKYTVGEAINFKWAITDSNQNYKPGLSYELNDKFGGYLVKKDTGNKQLKWTVGERTAGLLFPINKKVRLKLGWGDYYCLSPEIIVQENLQNNPVLPSDGSDFIKLISPKRGTTLEARKPVAIQWKQKGMEKVQLVISYGNGTFGDIIADDIPTNGQSQGTFNWTPRAPYSDASLKITGETGGYGLHGNKYDSMKLYFSNEKKNCAKFGWFKDPSWKMCFWRDAGPGCNAVPEKGFFETEQDCMAGKANSMQQDAETKQKIKSRTSERNSRLEKRRQMLMQLRKRKRNLVTQKKKTPFSSTATTEKLSNFKTSLSSFRQNNRKTSLLEYLRLRKIQRNK